MSAPCQFKDQAVGEVFIAPSWQKKAHMVESGAQTLPVVIQEKETQSTLNALDSAEQLDKAVGTENHSATQASMVGLQYVYDSKVPHNEAALASFLEAKKEVCLSILHNNATSTIFDNYEPHWVPHTTELVPIHTLTSPHAIERELHAVGLSWNASGTMLAVAYGHLDTSGWCYHPGCVAVWNLARPDLNPHSPHHTFETDTYATCVAFHPVHAHTLAVGTYAGEVLLFPDVTAADPPHSTGHARAAHHEPVTALEWVRPAFPPRASPDPRAPPDQRLLCSAAQDGRVLYWGPAGPLRAPRAAATVRDRRHRPVGVAALAHARLTAGGGGAGGGGGGGGGGPSAGDTVWIGLENGDVGCARPPPIPDAAAQGTTAVAEVPLELDWVGGHQGPVQALQFSPFLRHLFLTCSSDGTVNLNHNLEHTHILTLEPSVDTKHFLYDAQFSPFRPGVLAVVSRSSFLHIYDLQRSRFKPSFLVEAGVDGAAVISTRFSVTSADRLATGDTRGCVRVWKLPADLTQCTEQERAAMRIEQHAGPDKSDESKSDPIRVLLGYPA